MENKKVTFSVRVRGMILKNAISLLLCFYLVTVSWGCSRYDFPTDTSLKNSLEANFDSYEKIVQIALSEQLSRIEIMPNGELLIRPIYVDVAKLNISDIKSLLSKRIFVDLVNVYSDGPNRKVTFFNYRRGFVFRGEKKGIVYILDDSQIRTVDQLDIIDRANKTIQNTMLYKKIKNNWYIFYKYSP